MKASELRATTIDELESNLSELTEEQLRRRCNQVIGQLPNSRIIRQGRRDIARIKSIINEKRREQQ